MGNRDVPSNRKQIPQSLNQIERVHILGIGGTLMGAFACFLKRIGKEVTGCDQALYPPMSERLENAGIAITQGYDPSLFEGEWEKTLFLIGNVIRPDNPFARRVFEENHLFCSLPEFLNQVLLKDSHNIVIAGTHGKSTTSALLAFVLDRLGEEPHFFVGAVVPSLKESFLYRPEKPQNPFVLEGDEYDSSFWDKVAKFTHYRARDVLLTSIEFDHADIYEDLEDVKKSFALLLKKLGSGSRLIYFGEEENIKSILPSLAQGVQCMSYGFSSSCDASISEVNIQKDKMSFSLKIKKEQKTIRVETQLIGEYNALNVAAVFLECQSLGLEEEKVLAAIAGFEGLKRRQQIVFENEKSILIDDFAHHPTAVLKSIQAVRARFPKLNLFVFFDPRSATARTTLFQAEFEKALQSADRAFIAYPMEGTKNPFQTDKVVARLKNAQAIKSVPHFVNELVPEDKPTVYLVLSNGSFEGLIPALAKKFGEFN